MMMGGKTVIPLLSRSPNEAPVVNAGNDQVIVEGDTVALDQAAFTDPGADDTHTAVIDWGDGMIDSGTINPAGSTISGTHLYIDNGVYTVIVSVTDDDNASGEDVFTVTVNNVAPTINAGVDQKVALGETLSLDPATFNDPGADDTHSATINWGDGDIEPAMVNQGAGVVSGSHIYTEVGVYTVTVTVLDDDGGQGSDTFSVSVTGMETYNLFLPAMIKEEN